MLGREVSERARIRRVRQTDEPSDGSIDLLPMSVRLRPMEELGEDPREARVVGSLDDVEARPLDPHHRSEVAPERVRASVVAANGVLAEVDAARSAEEVDPRELFGLDAFQYGLGLRGVRSGALDRTLRQQRACDADPRGRILELFVEIEIGIRVLDERERRLHRLEHRLELRRKDLFFDRPKDTVER